MYYENCTQHLIKHTLLIYVPSITCKTFLSHSQIGILNLLSELGVDGENLRMADKSKGQNGDGVRRLKPKTHQRSVGNAPHRHTHTLRQKDREKNQNKISEPES